MWISSCIFHSFMGSTCSHCQQWCWGLYICLAKFLSKSRKAGFELARKWCFDAWQEPPSAWWLKRIGWRQRPRSGSFLLKKKLRLLISHGADLGVLSSSGASLIEHAQFSGVLKPLFSTLRKSLDYSQAKISLGFKGLGKMKSARKANRRPLAQLLRGEWHFHNYWTARPS
jgi:hypothetical protein